MAVTLSLSPPDFATAARLGHPQLLRYHLQRAHPPDVNARVIDERTALQAAAMPSCPEPVAAIKVLVELGADPRLKDFEGFTALHRVARHCPEPLEPLRLLLEHGADATDKTGVGWTALHILARYCQKPFEPMRLLLEHGADANDALASSPALTPLHLLLIEGDHDSTTQLLLDHRADPTLRSAAQTLDPSSLSAATPLDFAVFYNRPKAPAILLAHPAVLNQPGILESAITIARQEGHAELLAMLQAALELRRKKRSFLVSRPHAACL